MNISICLPIHNEETYLPYSIPALVKASVDELVILLDRCTDNSEHIIKRLFSALKPSFDVKILRKTGQKWKCPTAEVFEILFSEAKGDLIYTMACDIIADPRMFNPEPYQKADIVSYFYYNYDLHRFKIHQHYLNFLKRYINIAKIWKRELAWKSGLFGCKREVWENIHFRDVPSEYDDFLERALKKGYRYKFVKTTRNLHLRVGLSKSRQYLQGMSRAQRNVHPLMVLGHSLICLKPYVWVSYLHERKYQLYKTRKWGKEGYENS